MCVRHKFYIVFFNADVIFSTAHKSKGLEFDTVKLTDDYLVDSVCKYFDGVHI